ncbi:hypothetical protein ACQVP2_29510 [Methylobacterium aquaticum]|uniref:hypothetical protein n=1 Tax=Methylobacterium aquaticum TaxID=270351 RepID=UPI003D16DF0A
MLVTRSRGSQASRNTHPTASIEVPLVSLRSPSPNRRAVLASLGVALPAAAIVAPAAIAAAPAAHPDAALLAMEPRIAALVAEVDALCSARSRIEEACYAASGPAPDAPVFVRSDGSYERGLALFNDAMRAWRARHAEAAEQLGLESAEDAHGEADGRLLAACRELAAMPATTLEGLTLKARMTAHDGGTSGDIAPSILEDLIALGGQA